MKKYLGEIGLRSLMSLINNKKADKIIPVASGNLAALDKTGNLTDSGKSPDDFGRVIVSSTAPENLTENDIWLKEVV